MGDNHRQKLQDDRCADVGHNAQRKYRKLFKCASGKHIENSENRTFGLLKKGRKGRVDWRLVGETQQLDLPPPPQNGQLSIVGLERSKREGGGIRYVAGYPNFQSITEYNHSNKYAMAVSEMAEAFNKR